MVTKKDTYIEAVGRRKTATARVRISAGKKNEYTINDKSIDEYFKTDAQKKTVTDAVAALEGATYAVSARTSGGGLSAQAEAIRHGIARALVKEDETRRKEIKAAGFLKRDPRAKERKKFGLKGARKSPQWSKR